MWVSGTRAALLYLLQSGKGEAMYAYVHGCVELFVFVWGCVVLIIMIRHNCFVLGFGLSLLKRKIKHLSVVLMSLLKYL